MNDRRIDILLEPVWTEGDVTVRLSAREKTPRELTDTQSSEAVITDTHTHTHGQVVCWSPEALPLCRSVCAAM